MVGHLRREDGILRRYPFVVEGLLAVALAATACGSPVPAWCSLSAIRSLNSGKTDSQSQGRAFCTRASAKRSSPAFRWASVLPRAGVDHRQA